MKAKMNVLNLKKQLLSKHSSNTLLHSEPLCDEVIKMEPDEELEKENCDDEDYVTDLTLADVRSLIFSTFVIIIRQLVF